MTRSNVGIHKPTTNKNTMYAAQSIKLVCIATENISESVMLFRTLPKNIHALLFSCHPYVFLHFFFFQSLISLILTFRFN